jgi:hypothetical protein
VKAICVAGEAPALRLEQCPATDAVDRAHFLRISAAAMVDHKVGVNLHFRAMRSIDQSDKIFLRAKPRRRRSFLIEFTDIEEVVDRSPWKYYSRLCSRAAAKGP